jgi:hypothetical protein
MPGRARTHLVVFAQAGFEGVEVGPAGDRSGSLALAIAER